jgi:5,5'-dehydrodivanillate O-demethylase
VPVDDTHTMHLWYTAYMPPKGVDVPPHLLDKVHVYDVPWQDENGEFIVDNIDGQDMMAWITQGAIADRTNEHLGGSDEGVAFYRKMLAREIKKVERGQDPIAVFRDAAQNQRIDLPNERKKHHNSDGFASWIMRTHAAYSPIAPDLIGIFEGKKPEAVRLAG